MTIDALEQELLEPPALAELDWQRPGPDQAEPMLRLGTPLEKLAWPT